MFHDEHTNSLLFNNISQEETLNNNNTQEDNDLQVFIGDSWFGSVKSAVAVAEAGHHCVFAVKTAHSRSPKKWMEETMKDMPGGVWITMAGECKRTGVELFCLGYKYNKKKVLVFMCTKGVA